MRIVSLNRSLNWKMAMGFTALTMVLIALYTLVTKRTFEADKATYMAQTQKVQASVLAQKLDTQIAKIISDAKQIAGGSYEIFRDHPEIIAIDVTFENGEHVVRPLEKIENALALAADLNPLPGRPEWRSLDADRFALAIFDESAGEDPQILRIVFRIPDAISETLRGQMTALTARGKVLVQAAAPPQLDPSIKSMAMKFADDRSGAIKVEKIAGTSYFVHAANLKFGGLQILSILPEQEAAAPAALHRRSVIYLMLCFGVIALGTMLISNRWSKIILLPAPAAGDQEVNRLVSESTDRALLAHQRDNSAIVQQNLMPETSSYRNGHIRLAGTHFAADECGGDWWYYYQRDSDLYVIVADSTAQGIPAALMTAAARSAFSFIKDSEPNLKQIARRIDRAVSECSNGKTAMSGFLMKINVELGECHFINAGHEPAVLLRDQDGQVQAEFIAGRENPAFGRLNEAWGESLLQLEAGDRVFLWTDGLLNAQKKSSKAERRQNLLSYLETAAGKDLPPDLLNTQIGRHFTDSTPQLNDDATFALLDFRARAGAALKS